MLISGLERNSADRLERAASCSRNDRRFRSQDHEEWTSQKVNFLGNVTVRRSKRLDITGIHDTTQKIQRGRILAKILFQRKVKA